VTENPQVARPQMPASYGILPPSESVGLLQWSFVSSRMEGARNYWIATVTSQGQPHAAPVWGLWHQEVFYFSTDRRSKKGRNVAATPSIVVHLESGDQAVIIEGRAEPVPASPLLADLDALYFRKYAYHLDTGSTYKVTPKAVFAWLERDFTGTATRWLFRR